jgi:hypothetical protein
VTRGSLETKSEGMVEQAESDPTVHEIVVALRETATRRNGGFTAARAERAGGFDRPALATTASRQHWGEDQPAAVEFKEAAFADLAELRDEEMRRLLDENRHLNERIVTLIKIIEREQAGRAALAAALDRAEAPRVQERAAVGHEVRQAIEAELRPVLLTILKLLEKPAAETAMRRVTSEVSVTATSVGRRGGRGKAKADGTVDASYHSNWILDHIRAADGGAGTPERERNIEHAARPLPRHDGSPVARLFHRIRHFRLTTTRYD